MCALVLYLEGDLVGAEAALDAASFDVSVRWRNTYHRGLIAEARGDLRRALALYEKSWREKPGFPKSYARMKALERDVPAAEAKPER